jgi:hypothetical protein
LQFCGSIARRAYCHKYEKPTPFVLPQTRLVASDNTDYRNQLLALPTCSRERVSKLAKLIVIETAILSSAAKPYLGAKVQSLREKQADRERYCLSTACQSPRGPAPKKLNYALLTGGQLQLENGFRKMPGGGSEIRNVVTLPEGERI